jgi:hypothetical protein
MWGIGLAQELLAFQGLSSIELDQLFPTTCIPLESDVFATCGYIQDVLHIMCKISYESL